MLRCNTKVTGTMSHEEDIRRVEPARVYPASDRRDCWVVEAPYDVVAAERTRCFSGIGAQRRAVQFACETFGGARLFSS